jgi:anti-sigma B factor antagonist
MPRPADLSWFLAIDRRDGGPGETVLGVSGRLGTLAAARLGDAIRQASDDGKRHIVLDLAAVDYINSAGVFVLEQAAARLNGTQGSLTVTGLQEPVKLALELAGPLVHTRIEGR